MTYTTVCRQAIRRTIYWQFFNANLHCRSIGRCIRQAVRHNDKNNY